MGSSSGGGRTEELHTLLKTEVNKHPCSPPFSKGSTILENLPNWFTIRPLRG